MADPASAPIPYRRKLARSVREEAAALRRGEARSVAQRFWRWARPIRPDYRSRMRMTLGRWISYHHSEILWNQQCRWLGVNTMKNPLDAWIYQEILFETKPDVVVEIGSDAGGSTLYLASLMDLIGKGEVISVDIDRSRWEVEHDRITVVTGDSAAPTTVGEVAARCEGKTVMVIQDGDHRKEGVLRDLRAYAALVTPGNYFIVEDGIADVLRPGSNTGSFWPSALAATEEFLAENPAFEVDDSRERYIITWNPRGYLRRVA
jgi:cephalosporin hydroxylase